MRRTAPVHALALCLSATLVAGCGTDAAGPGGSLLSCLFVDAHDLPVGGGVRVDGAANQALCVESGNGAATYLYVPFHAAASPPPTEPRVSFQLSVLGAGVVPPTGVGAAPEPVIVEGPVLDHEFHARLRAREHAELGPLIRPFDPASAAARDAAPERLRAAEVPSPGDLVEYNVAISCTATDMREGRVRYVSDHAVVVAETVVEASLSAADYEFFGVTFDTLVHPVATAHFGAPTDIDGNGRVIIFITPRVNALSPPGNGSLVAGFFWSGDLFPAVSTDRFEACPAANQAEIFYVLAPDPDTTWGPVVEVAMVRSIAPRVIGHEYQHLINAARRMYVNNAGTFERTWLNEGLSHIAEELLFMEVSGFGPGENITVPMLQGAPGALDAFQRYAIANFHNFRNFAVRPDTVSLMGPDNLATRGATWSFLRYAADRSGRADTDFFHGLVNSTRAGLDNLNDATDGAALAWMRDWTVAVYADDLVTGLAPVHQLPSWDMRSILGALYGSYPLRTRGLAHGQPQGFTLQTGAAEFLVFRVGAGERATIHVESGSGAPPRALRGSLLRVQ